MPRTIAIGDIHGCAIALAKLIVAVAPQPDDTTVPGRLVRLRPIPLRFPPNRPRGGPNRELYSRTGRTRPGR